MALLISQVREIIKNPKNKSLIDTAIRQERWIQFHTVAELFNDNQQQAANDFLKWVKTLIPEDKFLTFVSLFRYPIPTIELTSEIFKALERVTDTRNPFIDYSFGSAGLKVDWEQYRKAELKEPEIWKHEGFTKFKTDINSILIIDLPREVKGRKNPYFYWLDLSSVVDISFVEDKIEWIIFKDTENEIAVFDDTFWSIYGLDKEGNVTQEIVKAAHGLGYCPARTFWTTPISPKMKFIKESPISNQLSKLDWVLFFEISKRFLDLYGAYPIISGFEQQCDYENPIKGYKCSHGFLKDDSENYVFSNGQVERCPVCTKKNIGGVGSFVEVPPPSEYNGNADLRNPVQITPIDTASLEYNVSELGRLKQEIRESIIGKGTEPVNNQAVNEKQVDATFDNKRNVLIKIKENFEQAQKWVDDTICRIRYGSSYQSSSINWGDEFFFYSGEELRAKYKSAKDSGATDSDLDNIYNQIIATEQRNNPIEQKRLTILRQLEPYRNMFTSDVLNLVDKDIATKEEYVLKADFSNFISRFERENTNVVDFGSEIDYAKKIGIIQQTLNGYVKEKLTKQAEPA